MNINENEIRLMSFNIRYENGEDGAYSWMDRREYVCDLVKFHCPDIIGFQEPIKSQLDYIAGQLDQYEWYGVGRGDGKDAGEFTPIFFQKDKFSLIEKGHFWLSETPEEVGSIGWDAMLTRVTTWVKLKCVKQDKILYVFNTHLDHEGVTAAEQSSLLILKKMEEIAGNEPAFLMGDFNHIPESKTIRTLVNGGLKDAASAVKLYGGIKTFHSFQALHAFYEYRILGKKDGMNDLTTIDYIFAKNKVDIVRHGILTDNIEGFFPSDHMPKVCDILL